MRIGPRSLKLHPSSRLFRLPLLRRYEAIVLGTHCFLKSVEASSELLAHEQVHLEQMERHGTLAFYMIYIRDYLKALWRLRSHDQAYMAIPFEIEAYARTRSSAKPSSSQFQSNPSDLIDSVLIFMRDKHACKQRLKLALAFGKIRVCKGCVSSGYAIMAALTHS